MKRARTVVGLVGFAAIGGSIAWGLLGEASAARDLETLLDVQRAEDELSFAGRRTITTDGPDGAVTTVLDVAGRAGLRRVKFVEARLPGGEVRRDLKPFGFVDRLGSVATGHTGFMARFAEPALILENYRLVRLGREGVAGCPSDRYALAPRHAGRASYRLWVDARTRMLMRFQVIGLDGRCPFDMSHESIAYDPDWTQVAPPTAASTPPARLDAPLKLPWQKVTVDDLRGVEFAAWLPARPPAGFKLRSLEYISLKRIGQAVQAWYSDGIASVMLFEFPANLKIWQQWRSVLFPAFGKPEENVARRMSHAGGTFINITLGGTEVFIAGQLLPDEMERVVKSLSKSN